MSNISLISALRSILPECLVKGPEPAGVTAGTEQHEPQESKPKVNCTASTRHPSYARHQVDAECNRVHYEDRNVNRQRCFYTDVYVLVRLCVHMEPVNWVKLVPLTNPKLVNSVNDLLVRLGDFLVDILVETRLNAQELGQRWEVVDSL